MEDPKNKAQSLLEKLLEKQKTNQNETPKEEQEKNQQ